MAPIPDTYSDNVVFLFKCIQSSGVKIDFNKAGLALGINLNAARMRYARLKKASEGGLNSPRRSVTCLVPSKITKQCKTFVKPHSVKKRKAQDDEDKDEDEDEDYVTRSEKLLLDFSSKRKTRGIKINYVEVSSVVGSSNGVDVNIETDKITTNSLSTANNDAMQSLARVSVSNDPVTTTSTTTNILDRTAIRATIPAEGLNERALATSEQDSSAEKEQICTDFLDFETGRKVSRKMFKKRKLASPAVDHEQSHGERPTQIHLPVSITKFSGYQSNTRETTCVDRSVQDTDATDTVTPNDSISMVGVGDQREVKIYGHTRTNCVAGGSSLLQRLSAFWK